MYCVIIVEFLFVIELEIVDVLCGEFVIYLLLLLVVVVVVVVVVDVEALLIYVAFNVFSNKNIKYLYYFLFLINHKQNASKTID